MPETQAPPFEEHYCMAVQELRSALIEVYRSVGADSSSPREAARLLGIDKNLTWKLGRIVNEEAIERIGSNMPGANAVQLATDAFLRAGVPSPMVERVTAAFSEFDSMVEVHTGGREALDLLLDSMAFSGTDQLVKSRKLAFRGNSGIWGAQARLRLLTSFLTPNADNPALLDYAQIGGYADLQRLRPDGAWPLFRFRYFNDDGSNIDEPGVRTLTDNFDSQRPHLLNDYTDGTQPDIRCKDIKGGLLYQLQSGNVGRTGMCSVYYGYGDSKASLSRYRDEHNERGEVLCLVNLPVEALMMDLIVHRSFAEQIKPGVAVYGRASGELDEHEQQDQRFELPMNESLKSLGVRPLLATPMVPRYMELTKLVFDRFGFDPSDFVAWRLMVPYPPLTSTVSIRFDLPAD